MLEIKESKVQNLIADYPWLLNINYERVPQLENKGMEYVISAGKRIDLILRDTTTERPVIVEFKAVPFYRENIGQILEYRTRIACECSDDQSNLKSIFGEMLLVPILILVVPECDIESKLACSMSGIILYEYSILSESFFKPENRVTLNELSIKLKEHQLGLNEERHELIQAIYSGINDILRKSKRIDAISNYSRPKGTYYTDMEPLFLNKHIFVNENISIGIYEDVFNKNDLDKVKVEFYAKNKDELIQFKELYIRFQLEPIKSGEIYAFGDGYFWTFCFDKEVFFKQYKEIVADIISNYSKVTEQISLHD